MASLSTVYEQHFGVVGSKRRIYVGTAIFLTGLSLQLIAVFAATTELFESLFSLSNWEAWQLAGILAGLGLPASFAGLISVLPLSNRLQKRVGIGFGVSIVGVLFFMYAFPTRWHNDVPNYSLYVVLTYMIGCGMVLFYAFQTIATVKLRNNPGGTVRLKQDTTPEPEPEPVPENEPPSVMGGGGIGVSTDSSFNDDDDESNVTDQGAELIDDGEVDEQSEPYEQSQQRSVNSPHDAYCGSCSQFEYLQRNGKMVPYCHLHEEELDDLEACSQWEPNSHNQYTD